jgi:hypothetical protein
MISQIDEQQVAKLTANPIAYAIEDVPSATGLTRTRIFQAIREGQLTARKLGRRTIIEATELHRFIATLPTRGREPDEATA